MEAHITQVLHGIARSMAPTGLKKALSFEVASLASQERVQQRLPLGLRAADGGSVVGSAEDSVSSGIQRRTVEQIVGLLVATGAKTVGEARPLGIAKNSTTTEASSGEEGLSWPGAHDIDSAVAAAAVKSAGEARPPLESQSTVQQQQGVWVLGCRSLLLTFLSKRKRTRRSRRRRIQRPPSQGKTPALVVESS